MSRKTRDSFYSHYSVVDSTLDDSVVASGQGVTDSISSTSGFFSANPELLRNTKRAMTLKTETIGLHQIPETHIKARDLINATPANTDTGQSVTILRHYCVVDGMLGARDPNILPPELFTVIYEFITSAIDDVEMYTNFRDINVIMLGQDYGVLHSAGSPGSGGTLGAMGIEGIDPPDAIVGEFGKQGGGTKRSDYGPSKDVKNSVFFSDTGIKTNKSIPLYAVYRAMLATYAGDGVRRTWISGVYVTVTPDSKQKNLSGWRLQYMHLEPDIKVKMGQKVKKGQLLGYCGRTGLMGPAKASKPHLHFAIKSGKKRGNPMTMLKRYFSVSPIPNPSWKKWIIDEKAQWYSKFSNARSAGPHGALDIGMERGKAIAAVCDGTVSFVSSSSRYTKSVARFKEAIHYYNQLIGKGNFVFRYKIRHQDGYMQIFDIPFESHQTIDLVGNGDDYAFDAKFGGKEQVYIQGRYTRI